MNLLEPIAKEIKKRISRLKRLRPVAEKWRSRIVKHGAEGDLEYWIEVTNLYFGKYYFILNFGSRASRKRVRINILPWEEKERTPRKLLKPMRKLVVKKREKKESPFISNPLYVSDRVPIRDAEAQIAQRLLQEGGFDFSNLVKQWLVCTFPKVSRIDDPSLSEVVEYLRMHFSLTEDWRAFRKYVKKIVNRFSARNRKKFEDDKVEEADEPEELDELQTVIKDETKNIGQDFSEGLYSVDMIVEMLGIPEGKLYRWVREGKIKKTQKKGIILLDVTEVRQLWEWKKKRKKLTEILSDHLKMDQDSARRWIKRLEGKGLNPEEIIEEARGRISKDGYPQG